MRDITDDEFDELVIDASVDRPILVFCYAVWAGPCLMLRPLVEALDERGDITVYALNVEEHANSAVRFEVKGVPALLLFSGSTLVGSKVGAIPPAHLSEWLTEKGVL